MRTKKNLVADPVAQFLSARVFGLKWPAAGDDNPTGGFGDDQPVPPPLIAPFKIALKVTSLVGKALRYSEEEEEEGGCRSGWDNYSLKGQGRSKPRRWIFSLKISLVIIENNA